MTHEELELFKKIKKYLIELDIDLIYYWYEDTNSIFNGCYLFELVSLKDPTEIIETSLTLKEMIIFLKKEIPNIPIEGFMKNE